ncbi:MAG: hypothetical protein GX998_06735 [Firmicutes bacterium]|nr:hypothetical protein [Bacillota bacterium]
MKRPAIYSILACCLMIMTAIPSVTAASFDLLLKGHWAYEDLTLLADAHLFREYDGAEELAKVFPLTRYEVALLVGEVMTLDEEDYEQVAISADKLMWEILEARAKSDKVSLSPQTVARARRDSEGASRALTRLAEEFSSELDALGIVQAELAANVPSITASESNVDARRGNGGQGSINSHSLEQEILACLGVTQLLEITLPVSVSTNGFTLSNSLAVEVRPLRASIWHAHSDTVQTQEQQAMQWGSMIAANRQEPREIYAPVEVTALYDQPLEKQGEMLQAPLDAAATLKGESLKLQPDMTNRRPAGLLTSYFLGRTTD